MEEGGRNCGCSTVADERWYRKESRSCWWVYMYIPGRYIYTVRSEVSFIHESSWFSLIIHTISYKHLLELWWRTEYDLNCFNRISILHINVLASFFWAIGLNYIYQGVVTCRLWKFFDRRKVCLITWSFPSEALDFKGSKVKLQSHVLWSVDFSSSEVTLIPWSAPRKGFDCLIQFRSRSQMLPHELWYVEDYISSCSSVRYKATTLS